MAKKRVAKQTQTQAGKSKYHCRDCANSYDWHSKAIDGHLILCRCPYKGEGGKWCVFLKDNACDKFVLRHGEIEQVG